MTRLWRAAGAISVFTLVSRILGLYRDRLMATMLGAGWVQGTFLIAWALPNLMRRLLGEGALSASFVPAYAAARKGEGDAAARTLLAQVVGTVITLLVPLSLLAVLLMPLSLLLPDDWLPAQNKGGVAATRFLIALNAILFPYTLPVCLSAVYSGALNTLGRFALPAAVPIVLNAFWIGALLLARLLGITVDTEIATFTAWFLAVGGAAQLLVVVLPLWRRGQLERPQLGLPRRGSAGHRVFVAMGPTVVGMSLNQVGSLLDQVMAYSLVREGANTYIYLANRLLLFPHALTAMAVAVAVFPRLADQATSVDRSALRRTLDSAAAATLLVTLPASFGLIVLCDDVVAVLFQAQKFTPEDAVQTSRTCMCLVAGLPFLGLAQLYARAFYAVGDNRAPARLAAWLVGLNFVLNLVLLLGFGLGTPGLAAASSVSSLVNAVVLHRLFGHHSPSAHSLRGPWLRSGLATLVMCGVIWLVHPGRAPAGKGDQALWFVTVPILVGMAVYFAVHVVIRSPELGALRRRRKSTGGEATGA